MSEPILDLPPAAKKRIKARLRVVKTTWIDNPAYPRTQNETVNHIGCSGGKDSTALLLWALNESGYPRDTLDVSFCDTGNEAPITYDYLKYLEDRLQIGITRIKPERDFWELSKWKRRFPSTRARFCTEYLKVIPTNDYINSLRSRVKSLILHSGVRAAESDARSQLPSEDFDPRFMCIVRRPLLKWAIADVWEMHRKYGVKPNPLYAMGMVRVGCFPCIMSRKEEIRKIAKLFPRVVDKIRQEESTPDDRSKGRGAGTFFAGNKVPPHLRSITWARKKDGKEFKLASIDDVVKWSQTSRGGKNLALDFDDVVNFEKLPMGESARSCPSSLGMCE